jgi:hypothetical protein
MPECKHIFHRAHLAQAHGHLLGKHLQRGRERAAVEEGEEARCHTRCHTSLPSSVISQGACAWRSHVSCSLSGNAGLAI